MFFENVAAVDRGLPEVERSIERLRHQFESWADLAYREGEQLRSRVGPTAAVAKEVKLDIGHSEIRAWGVVYPVHWTAQSAAMLFPELDADLVLTMLGPRRTSVCLKGTYQPPLGPLGRLADRAVLHRVAEATITDWMVRLSSALNGDTQQG